MSKFIVLNQIIYQDYHLLVFALNQNGHLYTFVCLGGQGSQRKQTGKKLENAFMIEVHALNENLKIKKLYLREFEVLFHPKNLRQNFNAWCVLNFVLEVTQKTLTEKELTHLEWKNLKLENVQSYEYDLLVKFIFILEEVSKGDVHKYFAVHLSLLYLIKILQIQGTFPDVELCHGCSLKLSHAQVAHFEDVSFYCVNCAPSSLLAKEYWSFLLFSKSSKYETLKNLNFDQWVKISASHVADIFDVTFSLIGLSKNSLKTYELISK